MSATAADIPPELFPLILDYIRTDNSGEYERKRDVWVRDMMSCSLVSLYWANRCRDYLFHNESLVVQSLTDFLTLESYAANGSTRLVPVYSLIQHLDIKQTWGSTAWCYRICRSRLLDLHKRATTQEPNLILAGPIPPHLSAAAYRSPLWSLPRSMPSYHLPLAKVTLRDIQFPCLSDLVALLRHFQHLNAIALESVTWSKDDVQIPFRRLGHRQETQQQRLRMVANNCTDDILLCILETSRLPTPPFSYISDIELTSFVALCRGIAGVGSDGTRAADYKEFSVQHCCKYGFTANTSWSCGSLFDDDR